jgi:hypothetical protein
MTRKDQQWKAVTYKLEIDGVTYYVRKGASRYARWYVLDADKKHLTSGREGVDSQEAAFVKARMIHEESISGDHT